MSYQKFSFTNEILATKLFSVAKSLEIAKKTPSFANNCNKLASLVDLSIQNSLYAAGKRYGDLFKDNEGKEYIAPVPFLSYVKKLNPELLKPFVDAGYLFITTSAFSEVYRSLKSDSFEGISVIDLGLLDTAKYGKWSCFIIIKNTLLAAKCTESMDIGGTLNNKFTPKDLIKVASEKTIKAQYGALSLPLVILLYRFIKARKSALKRSNLVTMKIPAGLSFLDKPNKGHMVQSKVITNALDPIMRIFIDLNIVDVE